MQSKSTNQAGTLWCKIVFSLPLGGWEKDYDYYAESPMLRKLNKKFLKMWENLPLWEQVLSRNLHSEKNISNYPLGGHFEFYDKNSQWTH